MPRTVFVPGAGGGMGSGERCRFCDADLTASNRAYSSPDGTAPLDGVCTSEECVDKMVACCRAVKACGHACGGVCGEEKHFPCNHGCDPGWTAADGARDCSICMDAVRAGLRDGTLDAVATDHAPHTQEDKEMPFDSAPPGMLGLEYALAVGRARGVAPLHLALVDHNHVSMVTHFNTEEQFLGEQILAFFERAG